MAPDMTAVSKPNNKPPKAAMKVALRRDRFMMGRLVCFVEIGQSGSAEAGMGRPSEIRTELTLKNGSVTNLRVGGVATKSMEGRFFLDDG